MSPESTYTVLNSRSIQNGQFYTILFFSSFLRPFCIVFHQDASLSHSTLPRMGSSKNLSGGRHLFFRPRFFRSHIFGLQIFWSQIFLVPYFWAPDFLGSRFFRSHIFYVHFLAPVLLCLCLSAQSGEERGCDLRCVFL